MNELPRFLDAIATGDTQTAEHLLPLVYVELKRVAHHLMDRELPGTLQTTALVHEAWLHLCARRDRCWQSPAHFVAAATVAMRFILIDRARRRLREKHGAAPKRLPWDAFETAIEAPADTVLALDAALEKFAQAHPRQAALVKLRYFGGLKVEEAAKTLGISESTAARDWTCATAWLREEIERSG